MLIIPAILEQKSADALAQIDRWRGVVPWIQIDVMDGTMTKDKTYDLHDLIGFVGDFDVEVHLMTTDPAKYFDACAALGAARVYFHLAEVERPASILATMDPYDFTKGIALSPQTPADAVFSYIDEIDAVQVMTVVPGAQGGKFLEPMLDKIALIRERRMETWIGVDGGVNLKTIAQVALAQPDAVGVGSALSKADDPVDALQALARQSEDMQAC